MAKKTTSRSKAEPKPDVPDAAAAPRARSRARGSNPEGDSVAAQADDRTTDVAGRERVPSDAIQPEARAAGAGGQGLPSDIAPESDTTTSISMGSEPSEEDIRTRAYQRYLERGGGHGRDFEDWLEAERELRERRSPR